LNTRYLELLGFVTHELMQPLSVLKGYLIMMEDVDPDRSLKPEQRRQAVSTMLRNVNMLINMSQTYLQLSKLESGVLELHKRRVGVYEEIILPVMEDKRPQLTVRNISFEVENEEDFQGLEVYADPIMLRIVYDNLVTNAIKYGAKGGRIYFGVQDEGEFFRFNVRNEGEGIPQDKLETIFEKFVRIEGKAEHREMGTGLGLYNAREIVRMHGGRIWAESVEGRFANFIFTLTKDEQTV
jgi:signal transduction histidine kinase